MPCLLFGIKPSYEGMLAYYKLDHKNTPKKLNLHITFDSGKCDWKFRLQNDVPASTCQLEHGGVADGGLTLCV